MKIRYVLLIALCLTVGPLCWAAMAFQIFKLAYFNLGISFMGANAISAGFFLFPFLALAVWVLTNMDSYERFLKRICQ